MASSEVTKGLMTEVAGQSIASAISAMGLSTIGNMSALTTTDKTSLVGAINEVKSGLTNVSGKVPIRGGFNIHCVQGINIFNRDTLTLVAGSLPVSSFGWCLMAITNPDTNSSTANTVETDGKDTIIINAQVEQNIYVTWLDLLNIPIQQ